MKSIISIMVIFCLFFSCKEKKSNVVKTVQKDNIQKTLNQEQKVSLTKEKFYEYDTLPFKKYISDNGHEIKLRGSQSRFLYNILTKSNKGIEKEFNIAENSYIANHSSILWDNDDFVFVRFGCGSPCWGGKVLNLNQDEEIKEYMMYLYEDSINNLIVYPDSLDWNILILEDLLSGKQKKEKFDFCKNTIMHHSVIDTIVFVEPKIVEVKYRTRDCEQIEKKEIKIEN